jgi:hypothetical protein
MLSDNNQDTKNQSTKIVNASRIAVDLPILAAVMLSIMLWSGCRSVPGLNRFARSSEPSADVLAGTGPSATYPAPPSASATPQAIASVAGGTKTPAAGNIATVGGPTPGSPNGSPQTSQVAGIDVSPGYATPATNYAAANANGVYTKPSGSADGAKKPSPYTFGSKTFTPKTTPETSPARPVSNYGSNGESAYAKSSFGLPATTAGVGNSALANTTPVAGSNYSAPSNAASSTASASTSIASGKKSGSGFTLPTSIPATATASITPPATTPNTTTGSPTSFGMRGAEKANAPGAIYSTADSSGSITASPAGGPPTGPQGNYKPGSTGKSSAYPGNHSETPATSGSFYR